MTVFKQKSVEEDKNRLSDALQEQYGAFLRICQFEDIKKVKEMVIGMANTRSRGEVHALEYKDLVVLATFKNENDILIRSITTLDRFDKKRMTVI